ncbi:Sulfite reductase [NADPH] hemoprotein beta-component [Roseimaritima multifibrata]|uniref:Sulfite reductase [NADPH] hemoprotein beta-component n=1 Tax=Roseimaritima multifibrata TaxID=1930274 RepID=A0A517MF80_9BACT|nr:NADPH-dependent assimilatory sulfite reductase hemoprotein subunit [Roseimaritima multifibrata]QDS93541.1 Sulfite reductase [NADPH] hemoprotein beta-component [Roseimaritima multifibrata]
MANDTEKLTGVEKIKEESRALRGTIGEELQESTASFHKDTLQLLKFHGTYQQDDRDLRTERKKAGLDKAYSCMVRCRIAGGRMTASQLAAQLDLCDSLGNSTLKITTRQTLQLHGILKEDLREAINRINKINLSTLAACGDVNRNVMCCPCKRVGTVHEEIQQLSHDIMVALAPRTKGYHELWITDLETGETTLEGGTVTPAEEEPLYGTRYLPRKFKVGIALPEDNCIDLYANDLGFLAVVREGKIIGYNVTVGGGMGVTPSAAKTFPALAKRMAFVRPEQAIDVAKAVLMVQRDFGNREDRKIARMKYLIANWGIEKFRAKVEEYYGEALEDCTEDEVHGFDDHMGWQEQGDGLWSYGLNVENGRLYDNENTQLKAAFRAIIAEFDPAIRLTAHQSIIFCDINEAQRDRLLQILKDHGVPLTEETSTVRRWSMACVGLPTCGLSVTESERALPGIMDKIEAPLAKLGLDQEKFTIRMTGCPNGCARPYNSDIALVGQTKDRYRVFVGGALLGTRLNFAYKEKVLTADVPTELVKIFTAFKANRQENETLGGFCDRVGRDELERLADADY